MISNTPEQEEQYDEEKRQIMIELLYKKRDELQAKQAEINQIHKALADLDQPAIHDVTNLRNKIDHCFSYDIDEEIET